MTISLSAMEKLLKKAGAERVADPAKEALKDILEQQAIKIGQDALRFAQHSGRKTIKAEDIRLATRG